MKIKTTMRYHLTASEWLSSERTQITEYIYIWTGRPGMLQFMGSKRVGHDWATELNWSEENIRWKYFMCMTCKASSRNKRAETRRKWDWQALFIVESLRCQRGEKSKVEDMIWLQIALKIWNQLFSVIKKEWNNTICSNMDGPWDYHTKWNKSEKENKYHMISLIYET